MVQQIDSSSHHHQDDSTVKIDATSQEQACILISFAIHHLLFAKGQIYQPIKILQKLRSQQKDKERLKGIDDDNSIFHKNTKSKSFNEQRKQRRFEEFMSGIDRLHAQIVAAIDSFNHSSSPTQHKNDDVVFLLRLGQSPITLAKQQFTICINGILSLPKTAMEADQINPPSAPIARQVFGGKDVKKKATEHQSSMSRLPVLERKLVRFLLSANMEESKLGKTLTAPIAPTKSQLFIHAPTKEFDVQGWIPRNSLKVIRDDVGLRDRQRMGKSENDSVMSIDKADTNESTKTTADEVDTLALGLSPLKRKAFMSPTLNAFTPKKPIFKKKPILWDQEGDNVEVNENHVPNMHSKDVFKSPFNVKPSQGNLFSIDQETPLLSNINAQEQMDAKRMARMHSRLEKIKPQNKQSSSNPIRTRKANSISAQNAKCATLTIDLSTTHVHEKIDQSIVSPQTSNQEMIWYASDVVLRACTL